MNERYNIKQAEIEANKIRKNAVNFKKGRKEGGEPDKDDYRKAEELITDDQENKKLIESIILKILTSKVTSEDFEMAKSIIDKKGWDYFARQSIKIDVDLTGIGDSGYILSSLRECMHKLGNPENLPIKKIENTLKYAKNDIEWMSIKSLIDLREKVENLQSYSKEDLISLAHVCDIDYWDKEKTIKAATEILYINPEEYYGLLENIHGGLRDMWTDYEGGPDTEMVIDHMDRWRGMTIDELLRDIYSVYSFNIITRYKKQDEILKNFILDEDDLRDKLKDLVKKNNGIFYNAMYRQECADKKDDLADNYFGEYNIIPVLGKFAEEEGRRGNEEKFGYAVNSTLTSISEDSLVLHSPTGRVLTLIDANSRMKKKHSNSKEAMLMGNFMSHENKLGERQYTQVDTTLAACLVFWDSIPKSIKEEIESSFNYHGLGKEDANSLISYAKKMSFEEIIDIATEYSPMFNYQLVEDTNEFIALKLKEITEDQSPHFIDPIEYLESLNKEKGETSISIEEVKYYMAMLNFSTIKYLRENLNLNLALLKRREFFSLLIFLKTQKRGEGFLKLKIFIGDLNEQSDKINRVKAFLSLENDPEMGERILEIGEKLENQPEAARKLFVEYANMVDSANEQADEIAQIYEEIFHEKKADKNQIVQAILKKAAELLWWASEELQNAEEKDMPEIVEDLISQLQREDKINRIAINNLKNLVKDIDSECSKITNDLYYDDLVEVFGDPEKYKTPEELNMALEKGEIFYWWGNGEALQQRIKKFDSKIINKIIDGVSLTNEKLKKEYANYFEMEKEAYYELPDSLDIQNLKKIKKEIDDRNKTKDRLIKISDFKKKLELKISEYVYNLKENQADSVLQKYEEILNKARNIKVKLKEAFKKERKISNEDIDKIVNLILEKARIFLQSNTRDVIGGKKVDEDALLDKLERYNAELVLTASIIKAVPGINPEDLEGVSFEKLSISDLTHRGRVLQILDEIKNKSENPAFFPVIPGRMVKGAVGEVAEKLNFSEDEKKSAEKIFHMAGLYESRYSFNEKLQQKLLSNFRKRLEQGGEDVICYIYQKDNEIISFAMFEKQKDGKKYLSSFNAVPETEKTGLGLSLLRRSLENESPGNEIEIEADTNAAALVSSKYIGKEFGFIGEKSLPNYEDTGILAFNIKRKIGNERYYYFGYNKNDLVREYENNPEENKRNAGKDKFILKYDYDSEELSRETERWINQGNYVLTNYSFSKDGKFVYCAFEKKITA